MAFVLTITPTALRDIAVAIEYYNEKAENLGYRFADLLDDYFVRIAAVPTASEVRYKNIRCKPMATFPYLIMYTMDQVSESVSIIRIFNTYQEPLW